jgi:hypothetical protein
MDDNYYLVLGIDPDIREPWELESRLKKFQAWCSANSNQGSAEDQRKAKKYLPQIEVIRAVFNDPIERDLMADKAATHIRQENYKRTQKIKQLLIDINSTNIPPDQLNVVISQAGGNNPQTQAEVRRILHELGKTSQLAEDFVLPPIPPTLDNSNFNDIKKLLQFVGKNSLYDFLGLPPNSTCQSLREKNDQIHKQLLKVGSRDLEKKSAENLCGKAAKIFKTDEEKLRYDNSLALDALEPLNGHLEVIAYQGIISHGNLCDFIQKCKNLNIDQNLALQYIVKKAKERNWIIKNDNPQSPVILPVCGYCGSTAQTENQTHCSGCGQAFFLPCPKCKTMTPAAEPFCRSCGFKIEHAKIISELLAKAQKEMALDCLPQARVLAKQILTVWPDHDLALEIIKAAEDKQKSQNLALKNLTDLTGSFKLFRAQEALKDYIIHFGTKDIGDIQKTVADGIAQAQILYKQGSELKNIGKTQEAFHKFSSVLDHCADHQLAEKALQALPPPAPTGLKVTVSNNGAALSWDKIKDQGEIFYQVIRRAQSLPRGINDAETVIKTQSHSCVDSNMPVGVILYYAVFSERRQAVSQDFAHSGPHIRIDSPSAVEAIAGHNQVFLKWKPPLGAAKIEVFRGIKAVPGPGQGTEIPVSGDSAVDTGVKNGLAYGYRISAMYPNPEGTGFLKSPAIGVMVQAVEPPKPVIDLKAQIVGSEVILKWTAPPTGTVQIRETLSRPNYTAGQNISLAACDRYGTIIPPYAANSARLELKSQGRIFFVPLSVLAQTVILGQYTEVTNLMGAQNLLAQRQGRSVLLRWDWPKGAENAVIAWNNGNFPQIPESGQSNQRPVTKRQYDLLGQYEFRDSPWEALFFSVFIFDPQNNLYSDPAQTKVGSARQVEVSYSLKSQGGFLRGPKKLKLVLNTKHNLLSMPPVLVVQKASPPLLRPEEGDIIMTTENILFQDGRATMDLPLNAQNKHIKLFFVDPIHYENYRLIPLTD